MKTVRVGLVGLGNMGRYHADYLLGGKVTRCELTAVSDSFAPNLERYPQLRRFDTSEALIRSGSVDALIIATPHYLHTSIGIDAMANGLHVLVEKPISVHKADCERLLAEHQRHPALVFAAMFQLRTEPRYLRIKNLIANGELGEIVRINWIITDWFRTEAYYASGGWRATWKGEGGGVLLNQCPHNLDLLQWLCGMPVRVRGFCQLGRYHRIEVEDNVTAFLEYDGNATGVFITSTGEAPGTNRFEIAGTRGRLVLENNRLGFTRNETPMDQFSRTSTGGFSRPDVWNVEIPFENAPAQHALVTQNFVDAVLDGTDLIAPGAEGIRSVELANTILYSSLIQQQITLPLDSQAYEKKLQELVKDSKFQKAPAVVANDDFTRSFTR